MAKSIVKLPKVITELGNRAPKIIEQGMNDITDDLLRVASLRAPVDSQTLEQGGTSNVDASGKQVVGQVSFHAINKGFNYAQKMDESSYNLGKKSLSKSSKGVRSKFTTQSMKVGTGYLTNTAEVCKEGYTKHFDKLLKDEIARLSK